MILEDSTVLNDSVSLTNYSIPLSNCLGSSINRENVTDIMWDFRLQGMLGEAHARNFCQLILFLTGVPLNVYVIAQILRKHLFSQATYLLFMNLAICDLLICIFTLLFNIVSGFTGHFSLGDSDYVRCHVCKIAAMYIVLNVLSGLNLALISLDRLAFFIIPLKYNAIITAKKAAIALIVIWVISFLFIIGPLIGYGEVGFTVSCGFIYNTPEHITRGLLHTLATTIINIAVVVILMVSNIWIACIATKQLRITRHKYPTTMKKDYSITKEERRQQRKMRREAMAKQFKLFKVFGGILLVNILTYIPITGLLVALVVADEVPSEYFLFCLLCILSQVTFHPLVEAFFTPELCPKMPKCLTEFCSGTCAERMVNASGTFATESRAAANTSATYGPARVATNASGTFGSVERIARVTTNTSGDTEERVAREKRALQGTTHKEPALEESAPALQKPTQEEPALQESAPALEKPQEEPALEEPAPALQKPTPEEPALEESAPALQICIQLEEPAPALGETSRGAPPEETALERTGLEEEPALEEAREEDLALKYNMIQRKLYLLQKEEPVLEECA